ncbi:MAG TPA: ATP-binding protein [Candidatus Limnocylindrales bacterium]|nr:ATP-binding protein [Candidatus Limnocylindrales bacterium]
MPDRDPSAARKGPEHEHAGPGRPTLPPRSGGALHPLPEDPGLTQIGTVIEGLPEPILLTDEEGRVHLTNRSADALFAGRPVQDREDLLSRFDAAPPRAVGPGPLRQAARPVQDPLTLRLRDQPDHLFAIESFPLGRPESDHQPRMTGRGSVFVLRDVTDSEDMQPEREAFVSIMSHELRTPLTTIYAGSSVLARNASLSPPATHTLALDISAEAARLYDLVEDLIVIARLERRVLSPLEEPVLLQRVLDATSRVIASRVPDVEIIRDGATDPPPVRGDANFVEQAARDLAVSAARAADPGVPLTIRLDHDEVAGDVRFRILDRGPQLNTAELAHAFDLPTDTGPGRLAGAGVGPFVARRLMEAMGGHTWAINRPDGGVEMGFALPIAGD